MPGRPPPFRVSHVFFDVDGTLVDFDAALRAGLRAASEVLSFTIGRVVTPSELTAARDRIARDLRMVPGALAKARDESFREILTLAGVSDVDALKRTTAAFFAARDAALLTYEDVEETVEMLLERGLTLVAATNGNSAMVQAPIFRRMHLLWTAEEARVSKPDPAFFLGALERIGAHAKTTLMVGDRMDNDVVPAVALGMYGALLDRGRRALDVDVPRLDSLADLLDLIEVAPSGG
ncbi:MAG: HAD family hydrolase [Dehalococcoidia bacterium]|nr:MAG: HAD family hydrolase [Dehalococcoidia bacterium]